MLPEQVKAMVEARQDYIMDSVNDGLDYDYYHAFMIQWVKPEYHSLMIASEQEYNMYLNLHVIN